MANPEFLKLLSRGPKYWNTWKAQHPELNFVLHDYLGTLYEIDLTNADLHGKFLWEYDLSGVDLSEANLEGAQLVKASFRHSRLRGTKLSGASLDKADFFAADLTEAVLENSSLSQANFLLAVLRNSVLSGSNLEGAVLNDCNLDGANINNCRVYGAAVWDTNLINCSQRNLRITPKNESTVTVDDLEVAHFMYLLLRNAKIRHIIDTLTSKTVLILGRFTQERFKFLEALRAALRTKGYVPILFDFDKPSSRDTIETISTLAHISRFIIADLTDAKSVLQELQRLVSQLPSVPMQTLLRSDQDEPGMLDHFRGFRNFLSPVRFDDEGQLISSVSEQVLAPPEQALLAAHSSYLVP